MNSKQIATTNMFSRVQLFFVKYAAKLNAYLPLKTAIVQYGSLLTELQANIQSAGTDVTASTKSKSQLKKTMVTLLVRVARKARVWASLENNVELALLFDIKAANFNTTEQEILSLANNVYKGLHDNAAALVAYKITGEQLTAIETAIKDFAGAIGTPQQAQIIAKNANAKISASIKAISGILVDVDDLLIGEFEETEDDMVKEYKENRAIGASVSRHTGINVYVWQDEAKTKPLAAATVTIVERKRTATTDANGVAEIAKFNAGDLNLKVSATGYTTKTVPFSVARGKYADVNVVMG